jgi:hypothetical protein
VVYRIHRGNTHFTLQEHFDGGYIYGHLASHPIWHLFLTMLGLDFPPFFHVYKKLRIFADTTYCRHLKGPTQTKLA